MNRKLIIFTDIGDTIIDEGSEVRSGLCKVVLHAKCIPGAKETMLRLHELGYPIAMVADGLKRSFENTMTENGLEHIFAAKVVSEELGVHKPDAKMFEAAFARMHLTDQDKSRVIMVGNNLSRDIVGANRFGIRSVLLTWSPRYSMVARTPEEQADYQISTPEELLNLAERLNAELER